MERRHADPMIPRKNESSAAHFIPFGATTEQLGFMQAPEPECLGRADSPCSHSQHGGEGHHEHEGHDHGVSEQGAAGHAHEHGGHEHRAEEPKEQEADAHEHMRVFPVFELDEQGQLQQTLNERGQVSEEAQRRIAIQRQEKLEADAEKGEGHEHNHEHGAEKPTSTRKKPRKKSKRT